MPLLLRVRVTVAAALVRVGDRPLAHRAQVGRDLVGQHLLEAETEEVRSVAAVGSRDDVAAEAGRAARPAVAGGAAVGEAGADGQVGVDVPGAVADQRPLPLDARELALEELAAAADRPGRDRGR